MTAGESLDHPVGQRLLAIVRELNGHDAGANGEEFWFVPSGIEGLQLRLSVGHGPCYDRSTNFAISYSSTSGAASPQELDAVIERIKALDRDPIRDVADRFSATSRAVARRLAPLRHVERPFEAARARQNVPYLDLCARLIGGTTAAIIPLHFGFWPTNASHLDEHDPFLAFSEHLLSYLPEEACRILDVGCGLGVNAKLLSERGKRVTALSPIEQHCAVIERAQLSGVDVRCARFEDLPAKAEYDLLLFSESVNHFASNTEFLERCRRFLVPNGFVLMADDLTEERIALIEGQRAFRILRSADITANVAPTTRWWGRHMEIFAAYHMALMSTLEAEQPELAARLRQVLDSLEHNDLKVLLSGQLAPPALKGRYMIYLLQKP